MQMPFWKRIQNGWYSHRLDERRRVHAIKRVTKDGSEWGIIFNDGPARAPLGQARYAGLTNLMMARDFVLVVESGRSNIPRYEPDHAIEKE
jgi:hypothetical protein